MSIKVMSMVWECADLSGSEKLAMLAMADWCNDKGDSLHPSMRGIAKKIGASECQARRIIHGLIDRGFLAVIGNHQGGNPGQARQYQLPLNRLITPSADDTPRSTSTPSMDATPTPSVDARASVDATTSMDARRPLAPMRETPSVDARRTTSKPSVNHQTLLSGIPGKLELQPSPTNARKKLSEACIEVLNFLNEKTGRNYQPVKANINLIAARIKEGATVIQCRQVIAKKCREWRDDPNREIYLRPKTLFNATNFANYQGELMQNMTPEKQATATCICCGKPWTKRIGGSPYCQEHDQHSQRVAA